MLIWWLQRYGSLLEEHAAGDSRTLLTARAALASVTAFVAALLFGPPAIHWLRNRFCETIRSGSARLNELHKSKEQTPTMGGLLIIAAVTLATLLWADLSSNYVHIALFVTLGFGALGACDDSIKLFTSRNGLSVRVKLLAQTLLALAAAGWLYQTQSQQPHGLDLLWPLGNAGISLGGAFVGWAVLVLVGSSNGVNLTDGLDGLASGCTIFAGAAFVALTYLAGHSVMAGYLSIPFMAGAGELAIVLAALVGAMLGFLWFNCYPAQVFMGDTGSLPIGALLGLSALVTRQEVLLVLVGGVFVVETLSVILQVGWFKLTGERLIACSPLHNHFLFRGEHEIKIVVRFWIGSALLAVVGIASLKIH